MANRLDVSWQVVNADLTVVGSISGQGGVVSFDGRATVQRNVNGAQFDRNDWNQLNLFTDFLRPVLTDKSGMQRPVGAFAVSNAPERYVSRNVKQVAQPQLADLGFLLLSESPRTLGGRRGALLSDVLAEVCDQAGVGPRLIDGSTETIGEPVAYPPGTKFIDALRGFAALGAYLPPYFDNVGRLRLRRLPTDSSETDVTYTSADIIRNSRVENTDSFAAPNTFVVVGGGATTTRVLAVAEVAADSVGSVAQRDGRQVVKVIKEQGVSTVAQAETIARVAAETADNRFVETVFDTVPNGRHDGYSVVVVNGVQSLEVGWSLPLDGTSAMTHTVSSLLGFRS